MMRSAVVPVVILGACALASGALLAQGPRNIQPLALEDRAGFEPMFDGTSLAGWEGDTGFWRGRGRPAGGRVDRGQAAARQHVPDLDQGAAGRLRAEAGFPDHAPATPASSTRSERAPDVGPFVLKGYQADIDFANQWTGQLYEERGRGVPGAARPGHVQSAATSRASSAA